MTSGQAQARTSLLLLLLLAAACGGGSTGPSVGSLAVSVSGLPGGSGANITVTGPDGFSRTLTGSTTLAGLAPGSYQVGAQAVTSGTQLFTPSPSSQTVAVSAGDTPASASVAYQPASGSLTIAVTGLPAGTAPAITVTGPGGYNQSITAAGTLSGLAAGTYTLTALAVSDGTNQYTPSPSSQSVSVADNATASATVAYSSGATGGLNLRVDGLYLVQSVQTYGRTVPLVRDRDALLRVFVTANQVNAVAPGVRVRLYSNGTLVSTSTISAPGPVTPQTANEGDLGSSWNLVIQRSLIQPNLSILVDVDPGNTVAEGNEADNSFPTNGVPLPLDVRTTSAFSVRFVPVVTTGDGRLGNVTGSNMGQFLTTTMLMHPLAAYDADIHAPYNTTTTATLQSDPSIWTTILGEINSLRAAEGNSRAYYGVVNPNYNSGVAGIGYIGAPVAVGWDKLPSASGVAAHEWGHNWGRQHAPCGGASNPDQAFPYAGGVTGTYGYDQSAGTIRLPTAHDLMGYCNNEWISDYTYTHVLDYRAAQPAVAGGLSQAVQPALLVWGRIENGRAVLEPAFRITTRASLPAAPGPYRLEGRAADGSGVFRLSFSPLEIADLPGAGRQFAFAVPLQPDRAARLASLHLEGEGLTATASAAATEPRVEVTPVGGGRVSLRWDPGRAPMVLVRDAATGQVISFARGGRADILAPGPDLSLSVSNRVGSRELRVTLPSR
jgi:hypothetical protein